MLKINVTVQRKSSNSHEKFTTKSKRSNDTKTSGVPIISVVDVYTDIGTLIGQFELLALLPFAGSMKLCIKSGQASITGEMTLYKEQHRNDMQNLVSSMNLIANKVAQFPNVEIAMSQTQTVSFP